MHEYQSKKIANNKQGNEIQVAAHYNRDASSGSELFSNLVESCLLNWIEVAFKGQACPSLF